MVDYAVEKVDVLELFMALVEVVRQRRQRMADWFSGEPGMTTKNAALVEERLTSGLAAIEWDRLGGLNSDLMAVKETQAEGRNGWVMTPQDEGGQAVAERIAYYPGNAVAGLGPRLVFSVFDKTDNGNPLIDLAFDQESKTNGWVLAEAKKLGKVDIKRKQRWLGRMQAMLTTVICASEQPIGNNGAPSLVGVADLAGASAIKYHPTYRGELNGGEAELVGLRLILPYGNTIDLNQDTPGEELQQWARRLALIPKEWFRGSISKRALLTTVTMVSAALLFGCSKPPSVETGPSDEKTGELTDEEVQYILNSGAFEVPEYTGPHGETLSVGAQEILLAAMAAEGGGKVVKKLWGTVATPDFVRAAGINVAEDLAGVFRVRHTNGGFTICVKNKQGQDFWLKLVSVDSTRAQYLELSRGAWVENWKAVGMSDEMIAKINLLPEIEYRGTKYTALVTPHPNPGMNLESAMASGKVSVERAVGLLEEYWAKGLVGMNQKGYYFPDPNFKNMILVTQDGRTFLAGVDYDGALKLANQEALYTWQYNELAARAMKRGVVLKPLPELVKKYNLKAIPGFPTELGALAGLDIRLKALGNAQAKILVPLDTFRQFKGNEMSKVVKQVEDQINKLIPEKKQGQIMRVKVANFDGTVMELDVVKTLPIAERVPRFGNRWAEWLGKIGKGLQALTAPLLTWWVLEEIESGVMPGTFIDLTSDLASPVQAIGTENMTLSILLDGLYQKLMDQRKELVAKASGPFSPEDFYTMCGIQREDIGLLASLGVDTPFLSRILLEKLNKSLKPWAPVKVQFQSQIPLLSGGAEGKTNMLMAGMQTENGRMIAMALQKEVGGEQVIVPIAIAYNRDGEWAVEDISGEGWKMELELFGKNRFTCQMIIDEKQKKTLTWHCEN